MPFQRLTTRRFDVHFAPHRLSFYISPKSIGVVIAYVLPVMQELMIKLSIRDQGILGQSRSNSWYHSPPHRTLNINRTYMTYICVITLT